jgi:hypothetical protein
VIGPQGGEKKQVNIPNANTFIAVNLFGDHFEEVDPDKSYLNPRYTYMQQ